MYSDEFTPKKLQLAVANLRIQLNGIDFSQTGETRFEAVRRKLDSNIALRPDEMFVLIQGIQKLSDIECGALSTRVKNAVDERVEFIPELSNEVLKLFYPAKAIDLALTTGLLKLGELSPTELSNFTGTTFNALFENLAAKRKVTAFLASLTRSGLGRPGLWLILSSIYQHQKSVDILELGIGDILDALAAIGLNIGEILKELDGIADVIMRKDSRWSSKLLSADRSVGFIVNWITKNKIPVGAHHKNLQRLLSEYRNLIDSLRDLDMKVPERGAFWRQRIDRADKVLPRRFFNGQLVGVAMWFGDYVIVEFGPTGNSAYIYPRETFDRQILNGTTWQVRHLVDKRIVLSGSRPGSIWHVSGWQTTASNFVQRIVSR